MMDLLKQAAQHGAEADVLTVEAVTDSVSYENNHLKELSNRQTTSRNLRLVKDGRLGMATSTSTATDDVLLRNALNTVQFGKKLTFGLPAPVAYPHPRTASDRAKSITTSDMIDLGGELVKAVNEYDPIVKASAKVTRVIERAALASTRGIDEAYDVTSFSVFLSTNLVEGQNILETFDIYEGVDNQAQLDTMKQRVINGLRIGRRNVPFKAGTYPVIFTPFAASEVLAPVLACVDGKAVMRGVSPWAKKRGELLFDERFSIIDDPTLDGKSGSYPFDGEGVAARRLPLIEKGVLKNFLHNLETAAAVGDEPNGHGTRSSGIAPGVTMVTPGDKASEEMIRGIDEGLLIEQTMGAWAGNPYGGQVTGNIALGYKIEKGKLVGRVKNVVFSLNVFSYLRDHLVGLSSDVRDLGGEILPYIMFKDVVLSTE